MSADRASEPPVSTHSGHRIVRIHNLEAVILDRMRIELHPAIRFLITGFAARECAKNHWHLTGEAAIAIVGQASGYATDQLGVA